jgi:hypothetical protein
VKAVKAAPHAAGEREVRRVTQESRNVRRREEAKREPLTKRTSTASSVGGIAD